MEDRGLADTLVIVLGNGTRETAYYSDLPIRIVVADPDYDPDDPDDKVHEAMVLPLSGQELPSWIVERLNGPT